VQATRLASLDFGSMIGFGGDFAASDFAAASSVSAADMAYAGGSPEEIVVTAPRSSEQVYPSIDATLYSPAPSIDELLAAASIGLALIEPTPIGEVIVAERVAEKGTKALSTIRYTRPGERFIRYESNNRAYSRVTTRGGVRPGTYAAPRTDGLVPVENRVSVYNLPDPAIPRTDVYSLSPPPGTLIVGPRPVMGGTGNEVFFPWGFP
jgi:hypothetical protein